MFTKNSYFLLKKELQPWLEAPVIDAHVHTATSMEEIDPEKQKPHPLSFGIMNNRTLSIRPDTFSRIFPDIKYIGFPLPLPFKNAKPDLWNNQLIINESKKGIFCLMHSQPVDHLEETMKIAREKNVQLYGIKIHPRMRPDKIKSEVLVTDLVSERLLDFAEKNKLSLLLELSHGFCEEDIKTLKYIDKSYNIKVIIPHFAQNHKGFVTNLGDYEKSIKDKSDPFVKEFKPLQETNNLYMDNALVIDKRVVQAALVTLGPDKILYGSDYPFGFTQRIKEFRFDDKILVSDLKKIIDGNYKQIYEIWKYDYNILLPIKALQIACDQLHLDATKKIMYQNIIKAYNLNL
ncbi:amidohydrolase family protein [Nanoarchaeota archaeon]